MEKEINFRVAIGYWKASLDEEQIKIEFFSHSDNDELPLAEITQLKDENGKEVNNIIASSNKCDIGMGSCMNLYPYDLAIIGQNNISLRHKNTGMVKAYRRISLLT